MIIPILNGAIAIAPYKYTPSSDGLYLIKPHLALAKHKKVLNNFQNFP